MKTPARTLYWQIAGLYLLLLLAFAGISSIFAVEQLDGFYSEVQQRVNRNLAGRLVREVLPAYDELGVEGGSRAAKRIKGINPSIDIYLLKDDGRVAATFTGKAAVRGQVELVRIREFLRKEARLPIRAADPGSTSGEKVFSAAVVPGALGGGYLYVVLPGMPFDSAAHMVRTSYIVRGAGVGLLIVLFTTLVAGLGLFFLLTRRFQRLTQTVRKFQQGAFNERAAVEPDDQIGRLAATFNEMAATIEMQFRALKQTDEARRAFATNISHDFRTPLTALRGFTDRLIRAEDRLTPDDRRQHLNAVLKSAAQLEHLADQLATMVHLDGSNDHALKLETFSIAELAQDSVVKFTSLATQRDVALHLLSPELAPLVVGDIAMIERALANLMENAIHNTPSGGKVTISLPVLESRVLVCIEDTGSGIAEADLPRVKQRFFRASATHTTDPHGSGLGLAIVDEIVAKHGSTLQIESRLGVGTIVSFSLVTA